MLNEITGRSRGFFYGWWCGGASEQRATALLATMALMSLPSHLLVGRIADHVSKPRLMRLVWAWARCPWPSWPTAKESGHSGYSSYCLPLWKRFFPSAGQPWAISFGRKSFATIRGTMSFFYLWGPALGPVVTGAIYDRYQSYAPMMSAYIALSVIAGCLYAMMTRPKADN